jgi:hypothetical protein
MNSILGWTTEQPTHEQVHELYTLLARTVVPPQEFWVPLRLKPDVWGQRLHPRRLTSSLLSGSRVEDTWSPAWDRLEAQLGICLGTMNLPAAAHYALSMLGMLRYASSILWEGPPGRSRMWVRQGSWVTPVPLRSVTEGVLWTWWSLSGGFHNYSMDLLPTPDLPLDLFPHYREGDRDALQTHPSKAVYAAPQWRGPRTGEALREELGVLYAGAEPVRWSMNAVEAFDWRQYPTLSCGLFWLEDIVHTIGPSLYTLCLNWRLEMRPVRTAAAPAGSEAIADD